MKPWGPQLFVGLKFKRMVLLRTNLSLIISYLLNIFHCLDITSADRNKAQANQISFFKFFNFMISIQLLVKYYCVTQTYNFPIVNLTRPAWAGFKTAEEGRTKIM